MDIELINNPKHYTIKDRTIIDAIFSNKTIKTAVYMSTDSYHMPRYGRIPQIAVEG